MGNVKHSLKFLISYQHQQTKTLSAVSAQMLLLIPSLYSKIIVDIITDRHKQITWWIQRNFPKT